MYKILASVVVLGSFCFFVWMAMKHDDLSRHKREEGDNFKLLFPRDPSPGWVYSDYILAELYHDYGLSDSEVERIARDGVHEAVARYRKSHPLDHPSSDDIDFINVFPGPGA